MPHTIDGIGLGVKSVGDYTLFVKIVTIQIHI